MDAQILFAFTFMTVFSSLRFTTVSGLHTATEELGSLETDGNQTDWTVIPLKVGREKGHKKRPWCKPYPQAQIIQMLGAWPGAQSYDGYNPHYMAFTWEEARKFPNLVTNASVTRKASYTSSLPSRPPTRPSILKSRTLCHITEGGCIECPTVTDLGRNKIPRYINEVTCEEGLCASREQYGTCKSAVLNQLFLYKTGKCDPHTGYEQLLPYTQEIRVCCKCLIFSISP
ncbi:putative skeletal organic matrix protein 8 [Oculina patagonica]